MSVTVGFVANVRLTWKKTCARQTCSQHILPNVSDEEKPFRDTETSTSAEVDLTRLLDDLFDQVHAAEESVEEIFTDARQNVTTPTYKPELVNDPSVPAFAVAGHVPTAVNLVALRPIESVEAAAPSVLEVAPQVAIQVPAKRPRGRPRIIRDPSSEEAAAPK